MGGTSEGMFGESIKSRYGEIDGWGTEHKMAGV